MSDVLPITNSIPARFVERKWMRAAKAWRCFIEIPNQDNIPEVLTALLERQVQAVFNGDGIHIDMNPAWIVDVPSRKRQFQVVIETVYEHQANLGPRLTALTDTAITLSIFPITEQPPAAQTPERPHDAIDDRTIRGLHISFFQNPKFWEWISEQTGETVGNPADCKRTFKELLQVESCKDITQKEFSTVLKTFNTWLNGGASA